MMIFYKLGFCVSVLGGLLYSYLQIQNTATELKIQLPELEKQVAKIKEENKRLQYQIESFEQPAHLIELAHRPEFSHLKHPVLREILTVPEAIATNEK